MIMKLTGLRELVGATSDPKGFGHNSISKKMRLMQKKSLTWLGNIRIFYHFRSFEMVKNVVMFTFWRRKSLLSVVKLCFLVLWILQTLHYTPRNYLVVKKDVKKFLDGFKIEYWHWKDKKHQNILPFQELWNGKKCHYVYVLKAQITSKRREALLFGSMNSSDITLPSQKLFGGKNS